MFSVRCHNPLLCSTSLNRVFFTLIILFTSISGLYSQFKNEEELKKKAAQYFEEEDYGNGYKLYSQLVSNYPKDPIYNYRLGVCMLFTEPDKKKPFPYLQLAVKNIKESEKEAYFYLGKAYHLNFQFDEAIKNYNKYKDISSGGAKKLNVEQEIQACKNGKRLLSEVKELVVLDKKQVGEADYFRSYQLGDIGGKLLVKPDEFNTSADKKKKNKSIVYVPKSNDKLFFASYGDGTGKGKDIFIVRKLPNGQWSKPENLGAPINTEFDEDYPFLHPNGKVLYFASKGHNTMGGYDIFKSEFDVTAKKWTTPVNLDFPINSPDDDILFVTDSLEKIAYFSSGRYSPVGKIDVYKVYTERRPAEFAYIKGLVIKKHPDQSVRSIIKVKNIANGENSGPFYANEKGEYSMQLANGGKFIFTVETPGFPTQSEAVNLPQMFNYLPLKQQLGYDDQKLYFSNYFDSKSNEETNYMDLLELIEEKARLDINADDFSSGQITNANTSNPNINNNVAQQDKTAVNTNTNNPKANLSNAELVKMAYEDAEELKQEAIKLNSEAENAFQASSIKQVEADKKKAEASIAITNANKVNNPGEREELLQQANIIQNEANNIQNQATMANNLANQLRIDAQNKQDEAELALKYAQALENSDKAKNKNEAIKQLESLQKELELASQKKSNANDLVNSIQLESRKKQEELNKSYNDAERQRRELNGIKSEIENIDNEIANTKDKQIIENLKSQREELTADLEQKNNQIRNTETKIAGLKNEADALKSQSDFIAGMRSGNNTNDNTAINNSQITNNNQNNSIAANNNNNGNNTQQNNISANNSSANKLNKIEADLGSIPREPDNKENLEKRNILLQEYVAAVNEKINEKNKELKNAKTAKAKADLNKEIKDLQTIKKEREQELTANNNAISRINSENNLTANQNNGNQTNPQANNGNNVDPVNTNTPTNNQNGNNLNSTEEIENQISTLLNAAENNFRNEEQLFSAADFGNPEAVNQKNNAGQKLTLAKSNHSDIINDLMAARQMTKETESLQQVKLSDEIADLNQKAEKYSNEAFQLRKSAKAQNGSTKEESLAKAKELEKQASEIKLEAAKKQFQLDVARYDYLQSNAAELARLSANKNNPDISKANNLMKEAGNLRNQADRLKEEASSESSLEAKSGSFSNADEKIKMALARLEKSIEMYKGSNPSYEMQGKDPLQESAQGSPDLTEIKQKISSVQTRLNEEDNLKNQSLVLLYDAGKTEFQSVKAQIDGFLKTKKLSPEDQNRLNKALGLFRESEGEFNAASGQQNDQAKNQILLSANNRLLEGIKELNVLKASLGVTDNAIAQNNQQGNNNQNQQGNQGNKKNQGQSSQNQNNSGNNNTTVNNSTQNQNTNNQTNTTALNSSNTPTVTPTNTGINEAEIQQIKESPQYIKYTSLENEVKKYETQANADKQRSDQLYSESMALVKESSDLRMKAANLPEGAEKEFLHNKANQINHESLEKRILADSLSEVANNTFNLAASKKQEQEIYLSTLDNKTATKIVAVSNGVTPQTNSAGTNNDNQVVTNQNQTENNQTIINPKYSAYSESYQSKATQLDQQVGAAQAKGNSMPALQEQSQTLTNYISAIDNEIQVQQGIAENGPEEEQIRAREKVNMLEMQKEEKQNALKVVNERIRELNFAANNPSSNNNTTANNTGNNTVSNNNSGNNTNALTSNNTNTNTNSNTSNTSNTASTKNNTTTRPSTTTLSSKGISVQPSSANAKIPINTKLPEGLIFKVQLGAFRNPIPANTFRGLNPVTGETTAEGYTRYQAGLFDNYSEANAVKNDVRKLGFNDAFVVAYHNGKRITLAEALAMLGQKGEPINNDPNASAGISLNPNITPPVTNTNRPPATVIPANASELNQVNGMMFTVQVGVYSSEVTTEQLYNLKPVFKEKLPNGYFRYTAGIYNNIDRIKADRDKVVNLGIKDAFVSSYLNGQRIPVTEALQKIGSGEPVSYPQERPINFSDASNTGTRPENTPENNIPVNPNPTPVNNTQPFSNGVTSMPEPTPENGVKTSTEGITYKVQIGAYRNQVPANIAENWLKVKTWPIQNTRINDLFIYTVGSFSASNFAKKLKDEVVSMGITDAFVVVYKDGRKLAGAEAAQYLNR